ncbi:hypothetical protein CT0861_00595, partial [Colletotrichum tofieldiae]
LATWGRLFIDTRFRLSFYPPERLTISFHLTHTLSHQSHTSTFLTSCIAFLDIVQKQSFSPNSLILPPVSYRNQTSINKPDPTRPKRERRIKWPAKTTTTKAATTTKTMALPKADILSTLKLPTVPLKEATRSRAAAATTPRAASPRCSTSSSLPCRRPGRRSRAAETA